MEIEIFSSKKTKKKIIINIYLYLSCFPIKSKKHKTKTYILFREQVIEFRFPV